MDEDTYLVLIKRWVGEENFEITPEYIHVCYNFGEIKVSNDPVGRAKLGLICITLKTEEIKAALRESLL